MATRVERRRFTVGEYDRMIDLGIIREHERVELVGGEIVRVAAMGSRHAGCLELLTELLVSELRGVASVRVQLPIAIPEYFVSLQGVARALGVSSLACGPFCTSQQSLS